MDELQRAMLMQLMSKAAPPSPSPFRSEPTTPMPFTNDEDVFQRWYASKRQQYPMPKEPDSPSNFYDYRSAFRADAAPDASRHWPSQFKYKGHENEVVGGFNTITGERVKGTPRASEADLVRMGWSPDTARRLASLPEPK
jgi:hypothetical protein